MKKILILFLLFFNFSYSNSLGLSTADITILKKIKTLTNDKMMKYTLMALAIKESSIGKNQVNLVTNDYGVFQGNIKSVIRRQSVQDNSATRKFLSEKLLNDAGFAMANAIEEINYWRKVHNENWVKVWASYNTGWSYNTKTGLAYSSDVFDIIKKLKYEYKL
jgi:hypothetical protein